VLSEEADDLLLSEYTQQLKQLLLLSTMASGSMISARDMQNISDAPASWRLQRRRIRPLPDGV
jgi:hypothetical protein